MNWDAVGAISEGLGSLAVFLTLGYLAVQVRHAREEVMRSAGQARSEAQRELFMAQATHPELAEALMQFSRARQRQPPELIRSAVRQGLDENQARRVWAFANAVWNVIELSVESVDRLTEARRVALDERIRINYGDGALFDEWYQSNRPVLNPAAVRYVDAVITTPARSPRERPEAE
jgi:hypothetical protein